MSKRTRYNLDIPDFLASIHDMDAILICLVDKDTRKPIPETRPIIFADARDGYYVVADFGKDENGKFFRDNFVAVKNRNFVIRRYLDESKIEFYDSDEIEE